jgi:hypothetical protein
LCAGSAISILSDESELVLASVANGDGVDVTMKPSDGAATLSAARRIVVVGRAFDDEDAAIYAGQRWRGWVEAAFSALRVAVDFGDRAGKGFVTNIGLEMASDALEGHPPTLNDEHGLMVYNDEPTPIFFHSGPATATRAPEGPAVVRTVREAMQRNIERTEEEHVAYDLFSASFNTAGVVDARFVMLMMAVEAILVQEDRSPDAIALVEQLRATVEASSLPQGEKDSLLAGMAYLHQESISKSGRRLAKKLGDRRYMWGYDPEEKPVEFFQECYTMRSGLVHGEGDRPTYRQVGERGVNLENFVADVLSLGLDGFRPYEQPDEPAPGSAAEPAPAEQPDEPAPVELPDEPAPGAAADPTPVEQPDEPAPGAAADPTPVEQPDEPTRVRGERG